MAATAKPYPSAAVAASRLLLALVAVTATSGKIAMRQQGIHTLADGYTHHSVHTYKYTSTYKSAGEQLVPLSTSEAFFQPITPLMFGVQAAASADDVREFEYMPAVAGMPDLPAWMHFRQANGSSASFLYGTPDADGDLLVELVALDRNNYDTHRKIIKFQVAERESEYSASAHGAR